MAKGITEVDDARLVGVYDIDQDKARAFASAHREAVVYESLDALFADRRVRAVIFCTPPACHAEQVTVALSAGKHVLLEKPLAHTLDDARQIRDAARRHNHLVAMVGSALLTFLPSLQIVRRWLQEGRLGKPYLVRVIYNHVSAPGGWFQDPAISGGGSLIDLAYHPLTVLEYLLGGSVSFDLRYARASSNVVFSVEDTVQLMVELNQSIPAYLELCWGVADPTRELEVVGDKGAAKIVFLNRST